MSGMSTPSFSPSTPCSRISWAMPGAERVGHAGLHRHGPAHRRHPRPEALGRQPRRVHLVVARGRAEVPQDGVALARQEDVAGVLVARAPALTSASSASAAHRPKSGRSIWLQSMLAKTRNRSRCGANFATCARSVSPNPPVKLHDDREIGRLHHRQQLFGRRVVDVIVEIDRRELRRGYACARALSALKRAHSHGAAVLRRPQRAPDDDGDDDQPGPCASERRHGSSRVRA